MLSHEKGIKVMLENPKSVFSLLVPEEKEELLNHITLTNFNKDDFIYQEGDKPTGFSFLIEGKIKIFKEGVGGREQIIRMTKPFGFIGYRALLADELHIATAMALEDSLACHVEPGFFFNRMLKNTDVAFKLLRKLARELGFSNSRTVTLTQKHIRGRLAESLLLLKQKYGFENDGATLKAFLSRDDIAKLSNMTTSNAIRTLSIFASEKVIAIDGRKIRILNVRKLERISRLG